MATITVALTAVSTYQSLARYHEFRSGWAWDLAYYNQWFWCLTFGDREVTVRPLSRYAEEGPSVWKMNYLAPIRFAFVPVYRLIPDPRTLIVIQNIVFWWVIPAAYTLVRSESGSRRIAVSAAVLVPLTPLLWPLVLERFPRATNSHFRSSCGRSRGFGAGRRPLAAVGISGMLACRQEFAVMAATFAFIPPRATRVALAVTLRWRHLILPVGLLWLLFGFSRLPAARGGPATYPSSICSSFWVPRPLSSASSTTSLRRRWCTAWAPGPSWPVLCLGSRSWRSLDLGPMQRSMVDGFARDRRWHHVRYALPMTALVLAAGLIGYAGELLDPVPAPRPARGPCWPACSLPRPESTGVRGMKARLDRDSDPDRGGRSVETWHWIDQVGSARRGDR